MNWVKAAEENKICPITHPTQVLDFIESHPGLLETCETYPGLTVEYAPQLTIPRMGGALEPIFEDEYQKSLAQHLTSRKERAIAGSGLTTNQMCPLCDEDWALRHPTFGDYTAVHIAEEYFHGGMFGPMVSPFTDMEHAVWLLSAASAWVPHHIHAVLLDGMKGWIRWTWGPMAGNSDKGGEWASNGALIQAIDTAIRLKRYFRWTAKAKDDAYRRIELAIATVGLPESADELMQTFVSHDFPQCYIEVQKEVSRARHRRKKMAKRRINSRRQ